MLKRIYNMIMREEFDIKERFFRILLVIGTAVFTVAVLEEILLHGLNWVVCVLTLCELVMLFGIYLTFWREKENLAVVLIGIVLIFLAFPAIFLGYGGASGDSDIWLVLGMAYIALMFRGKRLVVFAILTFVADVSLYWFAYKYPEQAALLMSHKSNEFDTLFSMICVGMTITLLLKFQINVYEKEWSKVKKKMEELEKVGESKDTFFANMSHEIRTPINTIIGLNEMTLRSDASEEIKENAIDIQNASKLLLELVNDILDMSKLETGKMVLVEANYDTRQLFEKLVKLIQVSIRKKNLRFCVEMDEHMPKTLYGDERRISQILLNLLTNAVKYTPEGTVTLEVRAEWMEEDQIVLQMVVKDTGIGIKKEDISVLFSSFQRVDMQNTYKIEGTGLGLSISKQLVNLMDGEITVDSIYTKGSTFTVAIRQKVVDATPIADPELLAHDFGSERQPYRQLFEAADAKVLLVDDDDMNIKVVQKLLQETQVQITVAHSGRECLQLAKREYFHVILLDYMMPGMSGTETMIALRKQENGRCHDSAIIALTGNVLLEGEGSYLTQGFDAYLEKPVNGALLEERILEFLPADVVDYRREEQEVLIEGTKKKKQVQKRKRRKVCITADCICDVPKQWRDEYDIRLMYLYIATTNGRFQDTSEVDSVNLARQLRVDSSELIADSASVEEYESFFAEVLLEAESIIHVSLGEHMGRSYKNAVKAAQSFGHVHVLNSNMISGGQGLLVLKAGKMAKEGYEVQEIFREVVKARGKVSSSFLMPSIKVFYERGYIHRWKAKLFDLLSMHPRIDIHQGHLAVRMAWFGKMENAVRAYIRRQFMFKWKVDRRILFLTHAGCSVKQIEDVLEEINRHITFENVLIEQASVSSTCNAGLGTIGIAFFTKEHNS